MAGRSTRWMVALGMPIVAVAKARGEDSVGFSHESYVEDHGRMEVQTESLRVQKTFNRWLDLTVRGVYDAISGATPIGAPAINQLTLRDARSQAPIPPSTITGFTRSLDAVSGASPVTQASPHDTIPLAESDDYRKGVDIATGLTFGANRFTPEISYSGEKDYISYALALNYAREFNDKNTTVNVGWSHSYDLVLANDFTYITNRATKNTDDYILGISQLLGPRTIVSASGTIGHEQGYLNDPYRSVVFDEAQLDPNARVILNGEQRPSTRDSQALLLSITQSIPSFHASIEGTYRFYHDSFGILGNTVGLAWFQKIGQSFVVSPSVRYYRQDAANFYAIQFPGSPTLDPAHTPRFYSSDYRLSYMNTFTLGLEATAHFYEHWNLHLGYQRYWMRGLDHQTLQSTYPNANIFTVGLDYTF